MDMELACLKNMSQITSLCWGHRTGIIINMTLEFLCPPAPHSFTNVCQKGVPARLLNLRALRPDQVIQTPDSTHLDGRANTFDLDSTQISNLHGVAKGGIDLDRCESN